MGCFRHCDNLVYFQYPDTITELMDYSLADTPSLEPIRLNKGLVYIRNFALNGAFNRAKDYDLFIPGSVTTIENNDLSMISAHLNSITFGGPGDANHLSNIDNVQFIGQNSYNRVSNVIVYGPLNISIATLFETLIHSQGDSGCLTTNGTITKLDA